MENQFREIVAQHKNMLYRICCAYTNDVDERNDIYQEVLTHIWKGLNSFRNESELKTWLYRIAVNTCLVWKRGEQRRRIRFTRTTSEVENSIAEESSSTDATELDQLYSCITRLRPLDRLLVSLYLEENDTTHIATVMGISEGNVRIKLHRIKQTLKELWKEAGYES